MKLCFLDTVLYARDFKNLDLLVALQEISKGDHDVDLSVLFVLQQI